MSATEDRRVWLGVGVLATLVIVGLAWLLVIAPQRSAAATLRTDTDAVQLQNAALSAKITTLREEAKGRDELTASLRQSLAGLPPTDDYPELSRQLSRQAAGRDVVLTGITVGSATTPGPATTAATGTTGAEAALTVRAIPITIVSTGTALQQLYFLRDIQQAGPRRALVTSTSLVPLGEGSIEGTSTMTTQLTVFSAPLSDATQAQLADVLGDDSD